MAKSLLMNSHPDLVRELVDKTLSNKLATNSNKKIEWKCNKGHVWVAAVCDRTRNKGTGCPYCAGKRVLKGYNDLATTNPDVVRYLVDPNDAYLYVAGSHKSVLWICDKGHVFSAPVSRIVAKGIQCPYCAHKKPVVGENDLGTMFPDVAKELVDKTLSTKLMAFSNKKVEWKCSICGQTWSTSVNNRTGKQHSGCPYCSGNRRTIGKNDLWTLYPMIAKALVDESLGFALGPYSERQVLWYCNDCDTRYLDTVAHRIRAEGKCPYCHNRRHRAGLNDLATLYPQLVSQMVHPEQAVGLAPHSEKQIEWFCENGHVYTARVANRTAVNSTGCPICSNNNSRSLEENDLFNVVSTLLPDTKILKADRKIIAPKELDIVIPSLKIAIEFNGVIWHSERWHTNYKTQHYDKTIAARKAGYQLIHIWSDDWRLKRDVVVRMLAHKLGAVKRLPFVVDDTEDIDITTVGARKLMSVTITGAQARIFLDRYHIQGFVTSSYYFGLVDGNGCLHAVMTVRQASAASRLNRKTGECEIQRFAVAGHVPGAFSKLMKFAENFVRRNSQEGLVKWISFSANDVSDGHLYELCGFIMDKKLPPDYKYVDGNDLWKRKSKESYQKSRFKTDPNLIYEDGWTEHEAALRNNLYRIYDAGKIRWVKYI